MAKKEPRASDKPTCKEWAKHLRPFWKRRSSKARRMAGTRVISRQLDDMK